MAAACSRNHSKLHRLEKTNAQPRNTRGLLHLSFLQCQNGCNRPTVMRTEIGPFRSPAAGGDQRRAYACPTGPRLFPSDRNSAIRKAIR